MADESRDKHPLYFQRLDEHTKILTVAFGCLQNRKILKFDKATVNRLLEQDQQAIQMMEQRPSLLGDSSRLSYLRCLDEIAKLNPVIRHIANDLRTPLDSELMKIFEV